MSKIVAKFSNGHQDPYKGKRPVKAAWMVVLPNGKIVSGHSNDKATAEKTARNKAGECSGHHALLGRNNSRYLNAIIYANGVARKHGFKDYKAMDADSSAKRAAYIASCKFEVVEC